MSIIYIFYALLIGVIEKYKRNLKKTKIHMKYSFLDFFWGRVKLKSIIRLCCLPWLFGVEAKRNRKRGVLWEQNRYSILNCSTKMNYSRLIRRRIAFESAMYHGNFDLTQMLNKCAAELSYAREKVINSGGIPIFAPMHICSDMLAAVLITKVSPGRTHVISINQVGEFGPAEKVRLRTVMGEDSVLIQHSPNNPPLNLILRELRKKEANFVIFPDILPQISVNFATHKMRSHSVTLFNRNAKLHSGAEDICRLVKGTLIPYYLYWDGEKIKIQIMQYNKDGGFSASFEKALIEAGDQWLLWHSPSIFYFNS